MQTTCTKEFTVLINILCEKRKSREMKTCNNLLILPLLMVVVLIHPINCSDHMTSFGYRLPSNSYAIFRLNHRTSIKNNEKQNDPTSRKSSSQEYFREKRHLTV